MTPVDRNNEPLDAILRRAMRAAPDAATPACADAESLAAYSDRSLATAERERLEAHFADCARCQMLLAAIARADESARGARATSRVPWYRRWRIAVPALAAVAAVVVFIAMRRPVNEEPQSDQLVAMEKQEAPRMEAAEQAAAPESPMVAPAAPAVAPASAPAAPASRALAMNEAKTEAAPRAEGMSGGTVLHRMATSATAPGPQAMTAQGGAAPKAAVQGYGSAAVGAAIAGAGAVSPSEAAPSAAPTLVTISTPDGSVTWIVGKNGLVQRRDADGTTHTQHSGVSTDLVAGSAPSATVCWIVGRSGTIIRTTDGEHWELITPPTAENLTSVTASSADDATVTTAGGRSFATSDGGASWHPQ
ncbi:MAG TPA: zf-HC2 domain-containing protein [Candidatus Binatus sp.]|uniref:zf-HC2 domain-containing protein n=1 Tax=Candidatus Binatus sp. TaxID=2811406 RepID=UPI002B47E919|nr:zf-HC2 domain-containing protein [Candidatus Binatus sp.]HKN13553.1 zf-HC2 domain-containing protein [Candidatus Binatus sp.]